MATKAKKKQDLWAMARTSQWDDVPPLPAGCESSLSSEQVRLALGGVSVRTFREMLTTGDFPREDWRLGKLLRWNIETVNRWLRSKEEGYHRGMGGKAE